MGSTVIKISEKTKKKLNQFKEYPRETYDEIIRKLILIVASIEKENEEFTPEFEESIGRGLRDIKEGKTFSTKEVMKIIEGKK